MPELWLRAAPGGPYCTASTNLVPLCMFLGPTATQPLLQQTRSKVWRGTGERDAAGTLYIPAAPNSLHHRPDTEFFYRSPCLAHIFLKKVSFPFSKEGRKKGLPLRS
jgi:hypothetical protein